MNKREFLRKAGFAVGNRGRFSQEMQDTIAHAESTGIKFDEPVKVASAPREPKAPKTPSPQGTVDATAARAWAIKNGFADLEGKRGRLPNEVLVAYREANVNAPAESKPAKVTKVAAPAGKDIRPEAPRTVPRGTRFAYIDEHGKRWPVTDKAVCTDSLVSLSHCPLGVSDVHVHHALTGNIAAGIVPVKPIVV